MKALKKCKCQSHSEKDKILLKRFVDRTTHSYERMLDANQDLKEYREYVHKFREFNKSLNLGPCSFYYQPRNQK